MLQRNSPSRALNIELVECYLPPCLFQQTAKDTLATEVANHLITSSLTSSYLRTTMVAVKLWTAPNQDLFLGFQTVYVPAKRAWSKVYSSPR